MIYAIFVCVSVGNGDASCDTALPVYYQTAPQCEEAMILQYGHAPPGSTIKFRDHRIYWTDSNSGSIVWYECMSKPTWQSVP